jgi:hypothetical protein
MLLSRYTHVPFYFNHTASAFKSRFDRFNRPTAVFQIRSVFCSKNYNLPPSRLCLLPSAPSAPPPSSRTSRSVEVIAVFLTSCVPHRKCPVGLFARSILPLGSQSPDWRLQRCIDFCRADRNIALSINPLIATVEFIDSQGQTSIPPPTAGVTWTVSRSC